MRAMVINAFGGPEQFQLAEIEKPRPGPDEIVIKVAYAGVNPADWKCREGWLSQFFDYKFPFIVGFDAAGIVSDVGEGVTEFKPGDRVTTHSNQGQGDWGSYAEYVRSNVERVSKIADYVDFPTGAAIPPPRSPHGRRSSKAAGCSRGRRSSSMAALAAWAASAFSSPNWLAPGSPPPAAPLMSTMSGLWAPIWRSITAIRTSCNRLRPGLPAASTSSSIRSARVPCPMASP